MMSYGTESSPSRLLLLCGSQYGFIDQKNETQIRNLVFDCLIDSLTLLNLHNGKFQVDSEFSTFSTYPDILDVRHGMVVQVKKPGANVCYVFTVQEVGGQVYNHLLGNLLLAAGRASQPPPPSTGVVKKCIRLGLMQKGSALIIAALSPKSRPLLDWSAETAVARVNSTQKRHFPKFNFSHGITNLTRITAEEQAGVIICLLVFMFSDKGYAAMYHNFRSYFVNGRMFYGNPKENSGVFDDEKNLHQTTNSNNPNEEVAVSQDQHNEEEAVRKDQPKASENNESAPKKSKLAKKTKNKGGD